jgi:hypothetical protein
MPEHKTLSLFSPDVRLYMDAVLFPSQEIVVLTVQLCNKLYTQYKIATIQKVFLLLFLQHFKAKLEAVCDLMLEPNISWVNKK